MKVKRLWAKAKKVAKRTGKELRSSPLGRASQGKRTKDYF